MAQVAGAIRQRGEYGNWGGDEVVAGAEDECFVVPDNYAEVAAQRVVGGMSLISHNKGIVAGCLVRVELCRRMLIENNDQEINLC